MFGKVKLPKELRKKRPYNQTDYKKNRQLLLQRNPFCAYCLEEQAAGKREIANIANECHHIDGDAWNNCMTNLFPICTEHHLKVENEKKKSQRYRH